MEVAIANSEVDAEDTEISDFIEDSPIWQSTLQITLQTVDPTTKTDSSKIIIHVACPDPFYPLY